MLVIRFILFVIYVTLIFCVPNSVIPILLILLINLAICILTKAKFSKIWWGTLSFLPFVTLTFAFNLVFDGIINATYILIKLLLVCMATLAYTSSLSLSDLREIILSISRPLSILGINSEEISLMICIALAIFPILKRNVTEIKFALRAKNMKLNLRIFGLITTKIITNLFIDIKNLDAALQAKGYS